MIYVIRDTQDNSIVDTTTDASSADYYASRGYVLESHADATDDERAALRTLRDWLVAHYDDGAHWIVETVSTGEHVVALREQPLAVYQRALRARWELISGVADDIRGA